MKIILFFALATAMLLLPFMNCEAQASLEFKKLDVNNINRWTNHRFSNDCCRIGDKVSSGVSISVTAELTNTSDDVLYLHAFILVPASGHRIPAQKKGNATHCLFSCGK